MLLDLGPMTPSGHLALERFVLRVAGPRIKSMISAWAAVLGSRISSSRNASVRMRYRRVSLNSDERLVKMSLKSSPWPSIAFSSAIEV